MQACALLSSLEARARRTTVGLVAAFACQREARAVTVFERPHSVSAAVPQHSTKLSLRFLPKHVRPCAATKSSSTRATFVARGRGPYCSSLGGGAHCSSSSGRAAVFAPARPSFAACQARAARGRESSAGARPAKGERWSSLGPRFRHKALSKALAASSGSQSSASDAKPHKLGVVRARVLGGPPAAAPASPATV